VADLGVEAGVDELGDGAGFSCWLQCVYARGWLWVYCCVVGEGVVDCELKWEAPENGDVGDAVGCDRGAEAEAEACWLREG
jgi:hypothetical protein